MIELHSGAATDTGKVRATNQDAFFASSPVYVVADGMGGHQGGEIASAIVVEEFSRLVAEGYDRRRAIEEVTEVLRTAQQRIAEYADRHRANGQAAWYAGTTVVAALLCEDDEDTKWLLVNLGDSRAYKLLRDRLEQVSVDHSVVQELLDAGRIEASSVASHPERHVVTRALGGADALQPDFFVLPLRSAPRLALCSDGVSGMVAESEIEQILRDTPDPHDAADLLVAAALAGGGEDNATAVVVDVVGLNVSLEQKLGALP